MRRSFALTFLLAAAVLALVWWARRPRPSVAEEPPPPIDPAYKAEVQPLFDRRCVPCHACFDSPCQLTLQSFEGFDRGGNKSIVYNPERPIEARPTRMFQDAQTTSAWRTNFGFFPVTDRASPSSPDRSILLSFVEQRLLDPRGGTFDVDKTTECPRDIPELDKEMREHPERGMPFGFPPLLPKERDILRAWVQRGSGSGAVDDHEDAPAARQIAKWEQFLNGSDPRTPLVSAYLFEHLFYAHLYFDEVSGEWFRLVRSRTPSGQAIDEIATRRPYDDPATQPFYYRLRRIRETLVEKTHAPYALGDAKLARLRQLFYEPSWNASGPRPYDPRSAANPFIAFASIPARSRYQFLLDDAHYHVQTFIHGPVCRGQAALDVIDDHFLIFFLAPDSDPAVNDPNHLPRVAADLELPAEKGESIAALSPRFEAKELAYLHASSPLVKARGFGDVWHGDDKNPDAVLTVFRHFDNAFVMRGAHGGMPKTAWILDYPIFERMYYDLVAGFDVYGNVTHQIGSRIYMNFLRIESEGQFLRLLPVKERQRVHDEWYRGRVARTLAGIHTEAAIGPESTIAFRDSAQVRQELIHRLLDEALPRAVVGALEPIQWPDAPLSSDATRGRFEAAMRKIMIRRAPYVALFPDTVLIRVGPLVYTIAKNRSHTSVEFIFSEGVELRPEEDTLQIVHGIATSRPNLFLVVEPRDLDEFARALEGLKPGDGTWSAFLDRYGVRRNDPAFWAAFDFFMDSFARMDPIGAAVIDLSRYVND
jgi:hypothetical protein